MICGKPYLNNMSEDYINYNYKMPAAKTKQTAVEWLNEHLNMILPFIDQEIADTYNGLIEEAKEMEKEQIEDAHIEGQRVFDKYPHTVWTNNQAEQYYEQTYAK